MELVCGKQSKKVTGWINLGFRLLLEMDRGLFKGCLMSQTLFCVVFSLSLFYCSFKEPLANDE